ncbi:MAG: NRDE family protein, partial [Bacteroidota bacterium]
LFEVMYDDQRAADEKLPDTGIGLERERALSSMFIKTNNYGSRCTTVILVDKNNQALFAERVYNLTTFEHNTRTFEFKINE